MTEDEHRWPHAVLIWNQGAPILIQSISTPGFYQESPCQFPHDMFKNILRSLITWNMKDATWSVQNLTSLASTDPDIWRDRRWHIAAPLTATTFSIKKTWGFSHHGASNVLSSEDTDHLVPNKWDLDNRCTFLVDMQYQSWFKVIYDAFPSKWFYVLMSAD